jgi:hypothetical protein
LTKSFYPKESKLSKADLEREYAAEFRPAKKQHSAVESAMNALEVHGLECALITVLTPSNVMLR